MDCDFIESDYFFHHQSSAQGEKVSESLDWLLSQSCSKEVLTNSVAEVLTNSVADTTKLASSKIVEGDESAATTNESSKDDVQQEVGATETTSTHTTNESSEDNNQPKANNEVHNLQDHNSSPNTSNHDCSGSQFLEQKEQPKIHVLPPRSNRGVPPNRYSPEHIPRASKYPIQNDRGSG